MVTKIIKKKTEFKGKVITFKNLNDLMNKLGVAKSKATEIIKKDVVQRYIIDKNDNFAKYDAKKKPAIIRNFGINKISNAEYVADNMKIKDSIIYKNLPTDRQLKLNLNIEVIFDYSDELDITRYINFVVTCKSTEIVQNANFAVGAYLSKFKDPYKILNVRVSIEVKSLFSKQTFELSKGRLREEKPLNIFNEYVNIEQNNNKDCAKKFLLSKLGRIRNKKLVSDIHKLGNSDGITPEEIIEYCKKYGIVCDIFKFGGEIYLSNTGENKSKLPQLTFLTYNNHLYPMKNKYLKKKKHDNCTIKIVKDCEKEFNIFISNTSGYDADENPILGSDIKYNGKHMVSFIVDDIKYLQNEDYELCLKILTKLGLKDKIYDTIKINHLFDVISKLYVKENLKSYLPIDIIKGGFNYNSGNDCVGEINTIDMNKAHATCLRDLPYLIKVDYRTAKINKKINDDHKIVSHYLYVIKPPQSSILLPNTNIYWGEHVQFCKDVGVEFEILEELETVKIETNYYTEMINNLHSIIDGKTFKDIINIGIGKFETQSKIYGKYNVIGVFNKEESKCHSGFKHAINDSYDLVYNSSDSPTTIYNQMPMAIQVKDYLRQLVYKKMCSLNVPEQSIIQIKTDAISYIGKLPKDIGNNLGQWKIINYKKMNDTFVSDNGNVTFVAERQQNDNVLGLCYAGCGKTYDIINNLIPKLQITGSEFIVLSPSHVSLEDYKKANINSSVIQKYTLQNKIPTEDTIIIDEFGMCDRSSHDLLIKCNLLGKTCIVYGDFKQLPPAGEDVSLSSIHYLRSIFSKQIKLEQNRRNTFTKTYYDNLINEKLDLVKEVKKYSTKDMLDAEVIICYRNSTVDSYNTKYMDLKNIKPYDVGLKLMCINNDLHHENLYNHSVETIISNDDGEIILSNGSKFTKAEINKNFKPAYAKTVYGVQGKSISSYYFASEDSSFINGKTAYTIISRLKENLPTINVVKVIDKDFVLEII